MKRHHAVIGSVLVAAAAAATSLLFAGPLEPPTGSIAPTYKTLNDVEPRIAIGPVTTPGDIDARYKITQPGSYYLTGNILGAGKVGIEIAASGVTIDLNGFELIGAGTDGIRVSSGLHRGISIRNGCIRDWDQQGIDATFAQSIEIKDVRVVRNVGGGIVTSLNSMVVNCLAEDNFGVGIEVFGDSRISGCVATRNSVGIKTNFGTIIENNTVNSSGGDGVLVSTGNRIVGNLCSGNGNGVGNGAGIHATGGSNHIESNTVEANDRGYDVDAAGNFIARNTARNNSTAYAITGTQTIGPIITATGTITTTNPWANFTY